MIDLSSPRNRAILLLMEMVDNGSWTLTGTPGWHVQYGGPITDPLWQALQRCELSVASALYAAEVCTHMFKDSYMEDPANHRVPITIAAPHTTAYFSGEDALAVQNGMAFFHGSVCGGAHAATYSAIRNMYFLSHYTGYERYAALVMLAILLHNQPHSEWRGCGVLWARSLWLPEPASGPPRVDFEHLTKTVLTPTSSV